MLTALDHIIIGVNDLEQATTVFSQKLGLAISGGGIHPSGGTANRIIVVGDTYLELIGVRTRAEAQQSMLKRLAKGDGYLNFVLSSNARPDPTLSIHYSTRQYWRRTPLSPGGLVGAAEASPWRRESAERNHCSSGSRRSYQAF